MARLYRGIAGVLSILAMPFTPLIAEAEAQNGAGYYARQMLIFKQSKSENPETQPPAPDLPSWRVSPWQGGSCINAQKIEIRTAVCSTGIASDCDIAHKPELTRTVSCDPLVCGNFQSGVAQSLNLVGVNPKNLGVIPDAPGFEQVALDLCNKNGAVGRGRQAAACQIARSGLNWEVHVMDHYSVSILNRPASMRARCVAG